MITMRFFAARILLLLAAGGLPACQGVQPPASPTALTAKLTDSRSRDNSGTLYVANRYDNRVTAFAAGSKIVKRRIKAGVNQPYALAQDRASNLYVANEESVTVYGRGTTTILRAITQCVVLPRALAFDNEGNLYVANDSGCRNHDVDVTVYPPGGTTLSRIYARGIKYPPTSLAFDAAGNLYVAEASFNIRGKVAVFPPQSTVPSRFITSGINGPQALAFDGSGNLYVGNSWDNSVTVYARGSGSVKETITEGVNAPSALAFDASGNLYVANFDGRSVTVYARGSTSIRRTITDGISSPRGLAFDPNGNLYVMCAKGPNHVSEYAPGSGSPFLIIKHGIHWPTAILFGS